MQNFSIKKDNKTYWVSRSMCTVGFVFSRSEDNDLNILAVHRGSGADGNADDPEKWCVPCGYLDYDETLSECCAREIYEETGVEIGPDRLRFLEMNSNPSQPHQNVAVRFMTYLSNTDNLNLSDENSESNEVLEIKWIPIKNLDEYEWAFNHDELIKKYSSIVKFENLLNGMTDINSSLPGSITDEDLWGIM